MICPHTWASNSGKGGKPIFQWLFGHRVMRSRCKICRIFAWITPKQWRDRAEKGQK